MILPWLYGVLNSGWNNYRGLKSGSPLIDYSRTCSKNDWDPTVECNEDYENCVITNTNYIPVLNATGIAPEVSDVWCSYYGYHGNQLGNQLGYHGNQL